MPPAPDPHSQSKMQLTERETKVLQLIAAGKRNRQIAILLGISARTAEHHVLNVMHKCGVETRTAALRMALDDPSLLPRGAPNCK